MIILDYPLESGARGLCCSKDLCCFIYLCDIKIVPSRLSLLDTGQELRTFFKELFCNYAI